MPSGIAVFLCSGSTLPQSTSLSRMVQTITSLLSLRQLTSLDAFSHLGSHSPDSHGDLQKHCSLFDFKLMLTLISVKWLLGDGYGLSDGNSLC
ncbi:hypothetical protein K435DRAFT_440058 [Dendrothele bispora CBS 962.96]|uniref:Uncharacterized protein n=1 Tax=Dendrothele bispora (strain CBS 962.96) TaxID=1314807 RepID=A0A4S8L3E8_DENBC|nr:hypothetical protein K435DRAFT_440058 [Dendrothele bispora CBS 962.96]